MSHIVLFTPTEWRKTQLLGIYDMFSKEGERICEAVAKDFGKPRFEAELGEVVGLLQESGDFLGKLEKYMAPEDVSFSRFIGDKAFVQREPFGLCLIIAPFNYPFRWFPGRDHSLPILKLTVLLDIRTRLLSAHRRRCCR
jgi:acyl-CoA reductase-like NAD-dependent aldehyde dehydrogenase